MAHRASNRTFFTVLILSVMTIAFASSAVAVPCDVDVTLDVNPRVPLDGDTVTYSLEFCDPFSSGADVFNADVALSRFNFVPFSAVWVDCPRSTCGVGAPDGAVSIGAFTLAAGECVTFSFTVDLQAGLGGQDICVQGLSNVYSNNPPSLPFGCPKSTDDPTTITVTDPTCLTVDDPVPGCSVQATVDPGFIATCAGSGDVLTCTGSETGCPGTTLGYEWTRDGVPIVGADQSTYPIPASAPPGGAQYRCIAFCEGAPACKGASFPAQVTVLGSTASITAPVSACIGQDADVLVTGALMCTIDCGDGSPTVSTCVHTCNYATPGTYDMTIFSDDGSCQITDVRPIEVFDQPVSCIDSFASMCETTGAGPTDLVLSNCSAPGLDYNWSTTLGNLSDPLAETPTLTLPDVSTPTTVTVSLTVSAGAGCGVPDTTDFTFDLLPSPTALAAATPLTACIAEDVDFTGVGSGTPGPFDFDWDFGDTNTSTQQNPTHAYTGAGNFTAILTVTDSVSACSSQHSVPILVEVCSTCPPTIPVVNQLFAWKSGSDVEMEWLSLVEAQDGYNVWAVQDKPKIPLARLPNGPGIRSVCMPAATPNCTDFGKVTDLTDPRVFYQIRGTCGSIEGE